MGRSKSAYFFVFLVFTLSALSFADEASKSAATPQYLLTYTPGVHGWLQLVWKQDHPLPPQRLYNNVLYVVPPTFKLSLTGPSSEADLLDKTILGAYLSLISKNAKRESVKKDLNISDSQIDAAIPLVKSDKNNLVHLTGDEFTKLQKEINFQLEDLFRFGVENAAVMAGELYLSNPKIVPGREWQKFIGQLKDVTKNEKDVAIGLSDCLRLPLTPADRAFFIDEIRESTRIIFGRKNQDLENLRILKIATDNLSEDEKISILQPLLGDRVPVPEMDKLLKIWRLYGEGPRKSAVAKWMIENFLNGNPSTHLIAIRQVQNFLTELLESVPDSSLITILNAYVKRAEIRGQFPVTDFERALAKRLNNAMIASESAELWVKILGVFKSNPKRAHVFLPYLREGFARGTAEKDLESTYKNSIFLGVAEVIQLEQVEKYPWAIGVLESLRDQLSSEDFYSFLGTLKEYSDYQFNTQQTDKVRPKNPLDPYFYISRHIAFGRCGRFMKDVNSQRGLATLKQ